MTLPSNYPQAPLPQLPVAIDYPAALTLRQMAALVDDLPKYLLAQEVSALFHYIPDLRRKMLFATQWNCGPRISEALAITPPDLLLKLARLRQRTDKAERGSGRVAAGTTSHRLVPLLDTQYVTAMEMMIAMLRIPVERRNLTSSPP